MLSCELRKCHKKTTCKNFLKSENNRASTDFEILSPFPNTPLSKKYEACDDRLQINSL